MNYSDIVDTLSGAGLDVFLPGVKEGICTAPYVVVQNAGTYRYASSPSLGYTLFTVHCFVPLHSYGQLDILARNVRAALGSLAPDLRPAGNMGIHIINDRFRAHETSIQYTVMRSL